MIAATLFCLGMALLAVGYGSSLFARQLRGGQPLAIALAAGLEGGAFVLGVAFLVCGGMILLLGWIS